MLLSDEDRLATESTQFLDYLENVDADCNTISCSVFDEVLNSFEYRLTDSGDLNTASQIDTLRLNIAGFTNQLHRCICRGTFTEPPHFAT